MAHKTLIGGTAYEISGGKTLIGGTAYSIAKGKTLVGGTAYEVGFAEEVTVTLDRSCGGLSGTIKVTINGKTYSGGMMNTSVVKVNVPIGTKVQVSITPSGSKGYLTINGTTVAECYSGAEITHEYTVSGNVSMRYLGTELTITEIPQGHAVVAFAYNGLSDACYVTINGTKYCSSTVLTVPSGTVITCFTMLNSTDNYGEILVNDYVVAHDLNGNGVEYQYTVNRDISIVFSSNKGGGNISIDEI